MTETTDADFDDFDDDEPGGYYPGETSKIVWLPGVVKAEVDNDDITAGFDLTNQAAWDGEARAERGLEGNLFTHYEATRSLPFYDLGVDAMFADKRGTLLFFRDGIANPVSDVLPVQVTALTRDTAEPGVLTVNFDPVSA